jgi:hypothetical protein
MKTRAGKMGTRKTMRMRKMETMKAMRVRRMMKAMMLRRMERTKAMRVRRMTKAMAVRRMTKAMRVRRMKKAMRVRTMMKMKMKKTRTMTKKAWSCPGIDKGPAEHGKFTGQQPLLPLMAWCSPTCSSSTKSFIAKLTSDGNEEIWSKQQLVEAKSKSSVLASRLRFT